MVSGDDMKVLDTLGKSKKAIGGMIAILLCIVAIFFAGMKFADGKENDKITSTIIRNQLTEINELAVYSYDYSKVGKFSNKLSFNGWDIPLTQKNFIITYDGTIKAGINLGEAKVDIDQNNLNITLPAIDENSIEVYDESSNIFNQISINDYKSFATKEKKKNEKDAISNGILTKSKEKVVQTLTTYLQAIPEIKDNYQLNITIQDAKTDE
jgi:hypothetical protein